MASGSRLATVGAWYLSRAFTGIHLSDADVHAFTAATRSDAGAAIYFTATWCGPCKMISPVFEKVAAENDSGAMFMKVDVDDMPDVAAAAKITAMPTFQFYRNGACVTAKRHHPLCRVLAHCACLPVDRLLEQIVGADADKLKAGVATHLS